METTIFPQDANYLLGIADDALASKDGVLILKKDQLNLIAFDYIFSSFEAYLSTLCYILTIDEFGKIKKLNFYSKLEKTMNSLLDITTDAYYDKKNINDLKIFLEEKRKIRNDIHHGNNLTRTNESNANKEEDKDSSDSFGICGIKVEDVQELKFKYIDFRNKVFNDLNSRKTDVATLNHLKNLWDNLLQDKQTEFFNFLNSKDQPGTIILREGEYP